MLMNGVQLMVIGMSVVFVFLILLVVMMNGVTLLARLIEPAVAPAVSTPSSQAGAVPPAPAAPVAEQPQASTAKIAAALAIISARRNNIS